jgi:hypothetical protein
VVLGGLDHATRAIEFTLSITRRYAHLSAAQLHAAVARLSTDTRTDTDAIEDGAEKVAYLH